MRTLRSFLCLTVLGGLGAGLMHLGPSTAEGQQKGPNTTPPDAAVTPKANPAAEGVSDLDLAYSLIHYGRKHKAPEALVTAAKILGQITTQPMKETPQSEKNPQAPAQEGTKATRPAENSPKALLEEAKRMSKEPGLAALADAVARQLEETPRGRVAGPFQRIDEVKAYSTDLYKFNFRAGELATVLISGDGDTDLDLYVYDENNNLVVSAVGPGDAARVRWTPRWTGSFTIKVVNRGRVYNRYMITTN